MPSVILLLIDNSFLISFYFIAATDFLTVEFAFDSLSDPVLSGVPEPIHLSGDVFGELG